MTLNNSDKAEEGSLTNTVGFHRKEQTSEVGFLFLTAKRRGPNSCGAMAHAMSCQCRNLGTVSFWSLCSGFAQDLERHKDKRTRPGTTFL